jgi:sugar lactone lactonase YvrE
VLALFSLILIAAAGVHGQVRIDRAIVTFAGNGGPNRGNQNLTGNPGYSGDGGPATSAQLSQPAGVAMDSAGNLYIADTYNERIREVVAATGKIQTIVGIFPGGYSGDGGPATSAQLSQPQGVAVDAAGNVYIADTANSVIREVVAATGKIQTVAGIGPVGFFSNCGYSGDGGPATSAEMCGPTRIVVDNSTGNLYIADSANNVIREAIAATGKIYTVAGNGWGGYSGDGGPATSAQLNYPGDIALDNVGNVYIADTYNHSTREVLAATGTIKTIAGNGTEGYSGDGGLATSARLSYPQGLALDPAGNVYIAQSGYSVIREVMASSGTIQTIVGQGDNCSTGYFGDYDAATASDLCYPTAITVDGGGNFYIADTGWSVVRKVTGLNFPPTPAGVSVTQWVSIQSVSPQKATGVATPASQGGKQEYVPGAIGTCWFDSGKYNSCAIPITFTPAWPGARNVPLTVQTGSGKSTFALTGAGTGPLAAFSPGIIGTFAGNRTYAPGYSGDGGPALSADLNYPVGIALDSVGNVYIADTSNHRIREVVAATGNIQTIAGNGVAGYSGDGGSATSASLSYPQGVAVDGAGNVYISDTSNHRIREVVAATGTIKTIAGNGISGYSGDGGPATSAALDFPGRVAVDSAGNVFIPDGYNSVIREVVAATGNIQTIAGNGTFSYSGDGGPATSAGLHFPRDVAVDIFGNVYIADTGNNVIREVVAATGQIRTIAGTGDQGYYYSGDGGPATSAQLNTPYGIAVDMFGDVYIADSFNNAIREVVAATGTIETIGGYGPNYLGDGGPATSASLVTPESVALDSAGNIYIAETFNNVIRSINVGQAALSFATTAAGQTSTDSPKTVTVQNIGNLALNIADVSYPADFPEASGVDTDCTSSTGLAAGASCTLSVDFSPSLAGVTGPTDFPERVGATDGQ